MPASRYGAAVRDTCGLLLGSNKEPNLFLELGTCSRTSCQDPRTLAPTAAPASAIQETKTVLHEGRGSSPSQVWPLQLASLRMDGWRVSDLAGTSRGKSSTAPSRSSAESSGWHAPTALAAMAFPHGPSICFSEARCRGRLTTQLRMQTLVQTIPTPRVAPYFFSQLYQQ